MTMPGTKEEREQKKNTFFYGIQLKVLFSMENKQQTQTKDADPISVPGCEVMLRWLVYVLYSLMCPSVLL